MLFVLSCWSCLTFSLTRESTIERSLFVEGSRIRFWRALVIDLFFVSFCCVLLRGCLSCGLVILTLARAVADANHADDTWEANDDDAAEDCH